MGVPAEVAQSFLRTGDEDGGVAGAAGMEFGWDGVTGDAAGGLNDLKDAEALSIAEVADDAVV